MDLARLYWFFLNDRRDQTVWLAPTWSMVAGRQGDYTRNGRRALEQDAPLLTDTEYDSLGMYAKQRDAARRMRMTAENSNRSMADRIARLAS
jgi:hypothetical protein